MLQRKFDEVVKKEFPNAKDAKDTSIHYLGRMQIEHKLDISKILMATSVCSDDINVPSTTFFNVLFGPFIMGGLGGLPFAGQTGMTAFAHHIPDEGSAFIFYGPHIWSYITTVIWVKCTAPDRKLQETHVRAYVGLK